MKEQCWNLISRVETLRRLPTSYRTCEGNLGTSHQVLHGTCRLRAGAHFSHYEGVAGRGVHGGWAYCQQESTASGPLGLAMSCLRSRLRADVNPLSSCTHACTVNPPCPTQPPPRFRSPGVRELGGRP